MGKLRKLQVVLRESGGMRVGMEELLPGGKGGATLQVRGAWWHAGARVAWAFAGTGRRACCLVLVAARCFVSASELGSAASIITSGPRMRIHRR